MKKALIITLPVFLVSLLISLSNATFNNLGFADAAEFALTAKLWSVAHAPGFPAYVFSAGLWLKLCSLFNIQSIAALIVFSASCNAIAAAFLALSVKEISSFYLPHLNKITANLIAIITGISLTTGATIWHWSHSVEVYSLHLLSFCMLLYGLSIYKTRQDPSSAIYLSLGLGLGFANHHLTMILFIPFLVYLLWKDWNPQIKSVKNKTTIIARNGFDMAYIKRVFLITSGIAVLFYGWMFIRASVTQQFAFGQPDSLDRLFYHLSGGAWIKNTQHQVKGLVGMRLPYFLTLTYQQLGLLFLAYIGSFFLFTRNMKPLFWALSSYFILILAYQLRIDQTADTDAYMINAFAGLTFLAGLTLSTLANKKPQLSYAFLAIPILQFTLLFPFTDLRKFDLSTTLLRQIDEAAPKNSVILIADWTSMINYTQARIDNGFRKDLVVLNYDIKFTHKDFLPNNYPEAYAFVKTEYDRFIDLLGTQHPQEIYNTGCTLDSPELMNAFQSVVYKLEAYAKAKGGAFMADPKAFVFLSQNGHFKTSQMSGSYVTATPTGRLTTTTDLRKQQWLEVKHIRMDAAAADKLVDLEAALDFTRNEYRQTKNTEGLYKAETAFVRVKEIQRELKKNMPFLFRPQGQ
jgi:hypothetical protein